MEILWLFKNRNTQNICFYIYIIQRTNIINKIWKSMKPSHEQGSLLMNKAVFLKTGQSSHEWVYKMVPDKLTKPLIDSFYRPWWGSWLVKKQSFTFASYSSALVHFVDFFFNCSPTTYAYNSWKFSCMMSHILLMIITEHQIQSLDHFSGFLSYILKNKGKLKKIKHK